MPIHVFPRSVSRRRFLTAFLALSGTRSVFRSMPLKAAQPSGSGAEAWALLSDTHIAGDPADEKIPRASIEKNFSWDTGVGAGQNHAEGLLALLGQLGQIPASNHRIDGAQPLDKPLIPLLEEAKRFRCRNDGVLSRHGVNP